MQVLASFRKLNGEISFDVPPGSDMPGTLVVDCSRCHGRTRLTYAEFAQRHLPYWIWTPWRRYSRYVVCPSCGQRAWISARWFE